MRQSEGSNAAGDISQTEGTNVRVIALNKEQLETELADARLLHQLSIELIQEDGTAGLYKKIVEAAVAIMRSQCASMQIYYPEADGAGKLRLLASSGFTPEAEKFWQWVHHHTASSCGEALRAHQRVIVSDFRTCAYMQSTPTLSALLDAGIIAAQSTPLYSRTGKLLGMISTQWRYPHKPPERLLELLDILARQAADLIERSQTAEALRESDEHLSALMRATNDAIYRMNPAWTEMYDLHGRNFLSDTGEPTNNWLDRYILPEDQEKVLLAISEAIQTKSTFQLEHRVVKADGRPGWVLSRAIPILDQHGEIKEWFGTASDITEKKLLWTNLETIIDERTRELLRSNEDLQQFAHVASHDLKEPVRKIKTFGLRLRKALRGTREESSREYTEKILESAERMTTMIEGVLSYSSIDVEDQKIEVLHLDSMLSDICNDLELLIQQKNARIEYGGLPAIEGVRVLIYQLFYNLINNSLKYATKSGQPVITIRATPLRQDGNDWIRIVVADNGIGFDPDHSEIIFNTFMRLHSKSKYDGTGLGLPLCRKIVERHHGTIFAEGVKNGGAAFTITLPVTQDGIARPTPFA